MLVFLLSNNHENIFKSPKSAHQLLNRIVGVFLHLQYVRKKDGCASQGDLYVLYLFTRKLQFVYNHEMDWRVFPRHQQCEHSLAVLFTFLCSNLSFQMQMIQRSISFSRTLTLSLHQKRLQSVRVDAVQRGF